MIDIRQGDCLKLLKTLPSRSVDAVVTDPPYNVGLTYNSTGDNRKDYQQWCKNWFLELCRIAGAFNPICISCGIGTWHRFTKPEWVLSWWKPASSGRCAIGFNNWEPILFYGTSKRKVCDVMRTTEQASLPVRHSKEGIEHPCPKPVEWAVKQLEMFTDPGDTILDPFLGSGTTAVACAMTGRNCIGFEIDPKYVAIARKRVADVEGVGSLFDPKRLEEADLFAQTV